jgi:hypothetical protein
MTYINQLQELYDTYPGKELEAALGVSVRSMQNYIKKDGPTVPGKDVQNRIREVYANFKEGKPLEPIETTTTMDSESRRTLERTLENLSEDKIRSTAIIERLVTMLERQFSSQKIPTTAEGTQETGNTTALKTVPTDLGLGKKSHQAHKGKSGDK